MESDHNKDRLVRELDIIYSPRRNAARMCLSREDLTYEDEELEKEQPLPLAIRGNNGRHEAERRRCPENRMIIHNRAIGDINTIAGGS